MPFARPRIVFDRGGGGRGIEEYLRDLRDAGRGDALGGGQSGDLEGSWVEEELTRVLYFYVEILYFDDVDACEVHSDHFFIL